jgi:uncharacterized protein (DUF885 family)
MAIRRASWTSALVIVGCLFNTAVASDAAEEQLDGIIAEHWEFSLRENPTFATSVGVNDFNDRLPGVSPADRERWLAAERAFLRRTEDIDRSALSVSGQTNLDLFQWILDDSISDNELNLSRIPFNTFSGFFMNALTASNGVAMLTAKDYEDYIARMSDIPRYFRENIDNMRDGVESDFVLPQIVIDGVLPTIQAQLKENPEDSSFYEPFKAMSDRLSRAEQERLRAMGRETIRDAVLPAFESLAEFLGAEYRASETVGVEQLGEGKAYYAFNIKRYTTLTTTTAAEIHQVGLAEVKRIREDMDAIIDELGFEGDFADFGEFLRTDPQFYAQSEEQLLKEAAYVAKRIDYVMPGYFGKLPRQPYGIIPVPKEIAPNYTTGRRLLRFTAWR